VRKRMKKRKKKEENKEEKKERKKLKEESEEEYTPRSIYEYGGLRSRNPDTNAEEILFIGIIDNLTNYTLNKKMANFFKNAFWNDEMLSTVPSNFYAERFSDFMTKNLLADEDNISVESDEEKAYFNYVENLQKNVASGHPEDGGHAPKKPAKKPVPLDMTQLEKPKPGNRALSPRAATERLHVPSHAHSLSSPRTVETRAEKKVPSTSRPRVKSDLVTTGKYSADRLSNTDSSTNIGRSSTDKSPSKSKRTHGRHTRSGSDGRLSLPVEAVRNADKKSRRSVAVSPRGETEKKSGDL